MTDNSKVGKRTSTRIASIDEVTTLITDSAADPTELDRLRAAGVAVTTV